MLTGTLVILLALMCGVTSQELAPTEQTVFSFPANGTGVSLPFPSDLAQLTGLSQWPEKWVTPPFTPNMAKLFNPSSKAILPDIIDPPKVNGSPNIRLITYKVEFCQTFDDGPTNVTPELLDFLDSVNQKTTFSEIGSRVIESYQITQREYASGHQIIDHTWSHPNLTSLSAEAVYAELAWTIYAIHAAIGQTPKYFRPPYGFINNNVRQVAAQLGLTVHISLQQLLIIGGAME
jgi:peptidoglycan/xylan/chitin deacetylase (PgdA/CDA1 family)